MAQSVEFNVVPHANARWCDCRLALITDTPRKFEAFLRSHGWSRRAARSIATKGFRGAAEPEEQQAEQAEARALELLQELAGHFGGVERLKSEK